MFFLARLYVKFLCLTILKSQFALVYQTVKCGYDDDTVYQRILQAQGLFLLREAARRECRLNKKTLGQISKFEMYTLLLIGLKAATALKEAGWSLERSQEKLLSFAKEFQ